MAGYKHLTWNNAKIYTKKIQKYLDLNQAPNGHKITLFGYPLLDQKLSPKGPLCVVFLGIGKVHYMDYRGREVSFYKEKNHLKTCSSSWWKNLVIPLKKIEEPHLCSILTAKIFKETISREFARPNVVWLTSFVILKACKLANMFAPHIRVIIYH